MTDRGLLLVHAHPDDEAIPTGVTMARYADAGVPVTLVTCTLGEEGEVVAPDLAGLAGDALGAHRLGELREACRILGVSDVRLLGGEGRWRDSGMIGEPTNDAPGCFWRADVGEAAAALAEIIREVRPAVVVTYDENGAYGHPDHIQAHRVTVAAFDLVDEPPAKLYYTAVPRSALASAIEWAKQTGNTAFFDGAQSVDDLPFGTPDELVTTAVNAPELTDRKLAALRAHRSQIAPESPFLSLPEEMAGAFWGVEHFTLARGPRGDGDPWETDLFAGL